jgi:23S rRNA (uridine2552-2'-O)-methyltransferase
VGNTGYVLGVDKDEIEDLPFDNVETLTADLTENNILELLQSRDSAQFDVILSDLSPNVSGVWDLDHVRQLELARISLRIARAMLKPEGNMLVKVFQGSELKEYELEMRSSFRTMRIVKPPASRSESAELYFLGLGFIPSQN